MAAGKNASETAWLAMALVGTFCVVGLAFLALYFFLHTDPNTNQLQRSALVAQIVGLATVIIAVGAIVYAHRQLGIARETQADNFKSSRDAQERNFALDMYRDYLRLAFEHPILADPSDLELGATFDHDGKTIKTDKMIGDPKLLYAKYEWFLSFAFDACEQLSNKRFDGEFDKTVLTQLGYHREYLTLHWANLKANKDDCLSQFEENPEYLELISKVVERKIEI
jgi:hypothetical protein